MTGDFDKVIGGGEECEIRVRRPGIAPRHAILHRRGDRLFVETLGGSGSASINCEALIPGVWREVTRHDELRLDKLRIELGGRLFEGRPRIDLGTKRLWLKSKDGRVLCDGSWLRAAPGTLTAVMGPSGCGKSVMLSILTGQQKADHGEVVYREVDAEQALDRDGKVLFGADGQRLWIRNPGRVLRFGGSDDEVGPLLGFVPQAEILIPELTVRESLDFRLRLRYPSMSQAPREEIMVRVAQSLGFSGSRALRFLSTRIGNPEERGRVLSGGERRRANIAHELVLQPLVLFLDEPTSGLSSVDTVGVVEMLQRIAREERIAIVATVHQPSREVFARFDRLALLGLGGKMLYHGPAAAAVSRIESVSGVPFRGENPAEFILQVQESPEKVEMVVESALKLTDKDFLPLDEAFLIPSPVMIRHKKPAVVSSGASSLVQWLLLCLRGFKIMLSDRVGLITSLGQVPLIGLLLVLALGGGEFIHRDGDGIARFARELSLRKTDGRSDGVAFGPSEIRQIAVHAKKDTNQVSEIRARQRAVTYFVLCLAAVWFGVIGSVREVVSEQALAGRECRSLVGPGPYLLSKFVVHGLITLLQVVGLVSLIAPFLLGVGAAEFLILAGLLWAAALTSVSLGLLISCVVPSYRAALGIVPLLVIPQVLFGGLLRPLVGEDAFAAKAVASLTIQRWVFPAMLEQDQLSNGGVLRVSLNDDVPLTSFAQSLQLIGSSETGLPHLFFDRPSQLLKSHTATAMVVLSLTCLALLASARTFFVLRIIKK